MKNLILLLVVVVLLIPFGIISAQDELILTHEVVGAPQNGAPIYDIQDGQIVDQLPNGTKVHWVADFNVQNTLYSQILYKEDNGVQEGLILKSYLAQIQQPTPTPPAATSADDSGYPEIDWPTDLRELPNGIGATIYTQHDQENCIDRVDMNEPCSTRQQEAVKGYFTLDPNEIYMINGDVIEVFYEDQNDVKVPVNIRISDESSRTDHDIVILYNTTDSAVEFYVEAFNGSNREVMYKNNIDTWEEVLNVVPLNQIRMIFLNSEAAQQAWAQLSTEEMLSSEFINAANCSRVEDLEQGEITYCDSINVYVIGVVQNTSQLSLIDVERGVYSWGYVNNVLSASFTQFLN